MCNSTNDPHHLYSKEYKKFKNNKVRKALGTLNGIRMRKTRTDYLQPGRLQRVPINIVHREIVDYLKSQSD